MNNRSFLAPFLAALFASTPLLAQTTNESAVPPETAMKASAIIAKIEDRADFRYLDELDWDDEGYYQIIYYTKDKAKVEMRINPVTGDPL
ncbi:MULTISPECIES: PepSY domain-containing protein [Chelativorans]|jgi:hypothetical protein|uniref:PepSY domain-containing protein n=1 Tax=Chelativorans sp. (strain BNC1) TaxID=266779 RepID=Q11DM8_CHESB|nr:MULTISPECIES: PepSY domain-containing protein [Chelativorans]